MIIRKKQNGRIDHFYGVYSSVKFSYNWKIEDSQIFTGFCTKDGNVYKLLAFYNIDKNTYKVLVYKLGSGLMTSLTNYEAAELFPKMSEHFMYTEFFYPEFSYSSIETIIKDCKKHDTLVKKLMVTHREDGIFAINDCNSRTAIEDLFKYRQEQFDNFLDFNTDFILSLECN